MFNLKFIFAALVLASSTYSFACRMENPKRHVNSDGSIGGLINGNAKVSSQAFISYHAKVCDSSIVERDSRVLGNAIILERSRVGSYVEVSENAKVGGDAYIVGAKNLLTIITGKSFIGGSAKIFEGSIISENAKVYGFATLKRVQVNGSAKICEKIFLQSLSINNDVYCSANEADSYTQFSFLTYDKQKLNRHSSEILVASSVELSLERKHFQVFINEVQLPEEYFEVFRNRILIRDTNLQREGWNSFHVLGIDRDGKKIDQELPEVFVGKGNLEIDINGFSGQLFNIKYKTRNKELLGTYSIENNQLVLFGIPSDKESIHVEVLGISKRQIIHEEFNLSSPPQVLVASVLPLYINNDLDFENFSNSWQVSHPENITIENDNGKTRVSIDSSTSERIEVAKVLRLPKHETGIELSFSFPQLSKVTLDQEFKFEIIFASLTSKKSTLYTYDSRHPNKKMNLVFSNKYGEDVAIFIRIYPSEAKSLLPFKLDELFLPKVFFSFSPYQISAYNLTKDAILPKTGDLKNCGSPLDLTGKRKDFLVVSEDLDYFSVGHPGVIFNEVKSNRIHATFEISGILNSEIENIRLLGIQNDIVIFDIPLADCAKKILVNSGTEPFMKDRNLNLSLFAFEIPLPFANQALFYSGPGSQITLQAFLDAKGLGGKLSNQSKALDLMVVPNINSQNKHPGVDFYDINSVGYLRTGGDKWILPGYKSHIEEMVANSDWLVNDISKINGGGFEKHEDHIGGTEADVNFQGFNFMDLINIEAGNASWQVQLGKIEEFINKQTAKFNIIDTFFITRSKPEVKKEDENGEEYVVSKELPPKFVESKFEHRCLGNFSSPEKRFVDLTNFTDPSSGKSGTILSHYGGHFNHLHVRFRDPITTSVLLPGVGHPFEIQPIPPDKQKFNLSKICINLRANNTLEVKLRKGVTMPSNLKLLWRYQGKETYNDVNARIQFGSIPGNSRLNENLSEVDADGVWWFHAVFADTKTGGCFTQTRSWSVTSPNTNDFFCPSDP